mmetsp:Transcript_111988/g.311811  ORF Transcript_111988/g.311811 Transcript_111988/m.311811 type:complete len:207 (+) Transcript_111988:1121-1741(+)
MGLSGKNRVGGGSGQVPHGSPLGRRPSWWNQPCASWERARVRFCRPGDAPQLHRLRLLSRQGDPGVELAVRRAGQREAAVYQPVLANEARLANSGSPREQVHVRQGAPGLCPEGAGGAAGVRGQLPQDAARLLAAGPLLGAPRAGPRVPAALLEPDGLQPAGHAAALHRRGLERARPQRRAGLLLRRPVRPSVVPRVRSVQLHLLS